MGIERIVGYISDNEERRENDLRVLNMLITYYI